MPAVHTSHLASPSARRAAGRRSVVTRAAGLRWKKAPEEKKEGAIDLTGLKQLVQMGLGSIAGDITEINLDDPARTVVMELEANQFEDADGKPLSLKFMNNEGIVDEEAKETPLVNLLLPVLLGLVTLGGVFATLKALS